MPRALWKGAIAFGLVNIPVELHPGVRDSRPRFRMLHAEDKSPIKFERVCAREGKPVAWEELVKGYEYQKGRFVVLTKEDFQHAALEKSRTVDIRNFVKADEIDDRFFETSYYLVPPKDAEKAYALLREAMRDTGLVGIATIVFRDAQHLAALDVVGNAIVLTQMRYAEELVDTDAYTFPAAKDVVSRPARATVPAKELAMAERLISSLAGPWDPRRYEDTYRQHVLALVKKKERGEVIEAPATPEQPSRVIDLMEALKATLERNKKPLRGRGRAAAAHAQHRR